MSAKEKKKPTPKSELDMNSCFSKHHLLLANPYGIEEINKENTFERTKSNSKKNSPYSLEKHLKRAFRHIGKYGFITLRNMQALTNSATTRHQEN